MSRTPPLRAEDFRLANAQSQLPKAPRAALASAAALARDFPLDDRAQRLHGLALLACGDARAGFDALTRAVAIDTRSAANWLALAELYGSLGQREDLLASVHRAADVAPRDAELWLRIAALARAARDVDLDRRALASVIDAQPGNVRARLDLASIELDQGLLADAERTARAAVAADSDSADAHFVLGTVLGAQSRHVEAITAYRRAVECTPLHLRAWFNLGAALDEARDYAGAARAFTRVLDIDSEQHAARAHLLFLNRRLAKWGSLDALSSRVRKAVREGEAGVEPFAFLSEPASGAEQLACARLRSLAAMAEVEADGLPADTAVPQGAVRVGFVSSGFNQHPTAALIVELIEQLRETPIITLGFATTADDGGDLRRRLRQSFHEFHDVSGLSMPALARKLRASGAEILIDLRGHGGGSVTPAFALRPAPVQVNWLAYPGTSGAPFIDYMVADRFVAPSEHREDFSECIASMPYCFQPSDSTRVIEDPPSRSECGLPQAGPVFASFNNGYKIGPDPFAAWMEILGGVDDSVLWLLDAQESGFAARLGQQAKAAGIDPERLRFMHKLPHAEYLARYRHVDLFLDTWPYNAHTTASDALWSGCPLLTWPGDTFASRVAGSLLRTLGLRDLLVESRVEYVARAIEFGSDAERLVALRGDIARRRRIAPLFDMQRFARDFAMLLGHMSERHRSGQPPECFALDGGGRIIH